MRTRSLVMLALLALVASACAGSSESSTTQAVQPSTTTSAFNQPDEVLLSYDLADGDSFVYDVAIDQNIQLEAEGESSGLGDEELPGTADVNISGTGTFTFDIADGAQPNTYEVTINGDFDDLAVTGTVDGEPVSDEELPDFAELGPVSTTVIVDDRGNVIPPDPSVDDPFGGMFGGLESLGSDSIPGAQLGQFFGPPFGDVAVTVGDSWSATIETPGLGDEPIATSVESSVTGTDTVDGVEVLVIETSTSVAAFEFDLGEFFIGLFSGFMPQEPSAEEQAEIDALIENLRFVISSDEAVSDSTTYFDSEAGVTRMFEVSSQANMGFDVNFPDEGTGEMVGFVMNMKIDQKVTHNLVDGPTA